MPVSSRIRICGGSRACPAAWHFWPCRQFMRRMCFCAAISTRMARGVFPPRSLFPRLRKFRTRPGWNFNFSILPDSLFSKPHCKRRPNGRGSPINISVAWPASIRTSRRSILGTMKAPRFIPRSSPCAMVTAFRTRRLKSDSGGSKCATAHFWSTAAAFFFAESTATASTPSMDGRCQRKRCGETSR